MTPNRVVVVLSPLFIALAGWVVEWVANNFPGAPQLDRGQLTAVFIAGATFAAAHVAQWLHGWEKHEARKLATAAPVMTGSSGGPGQTSSSAAATLAKQDTELPPPPPPLNVKPTPPLGEQA